MPIWVIYMSCLSNTIPVISDRSLVDLIKMKAFNTKHVTVCLSTCEEWENYLKLLLEKGQKDANKATRL